MSHVDPVLAIPLGAFFAVVSAWITLAPGQFPREHGRVRVLEGLLGPEATTVVLRVAGAGLAVGSAWLAVHAAIAVVSA